TVGLRLLWAESETHCASAVHVADKRLVLDDHACCGISWHTVAEGQHKLEDGAVFDFVGRSRHTVEAGARSLPRAHVASTPARLKWHRRIAAQEPADGR